MKNIRTKYALLMWVKFISAALLTGFLSAVLAMTLKHVTEHFEESLFLKANNHTFYLLLFPLTGFSVIYFLRKYLFKNRENKGIKEVFDSVSNGKSLKEYKVVSHFINGLITVGFGGSTGIEVSTVVSTAALGDITHKKDRLLKKRKTELICAGIAAGITVLFSSPLAGILFAYEVVTKKITKYFVAATVVGVVAANALLSFFEEKQLFTVSITTWKPYALPYFILLGILAGINSVYLTKTVLYIKKLFLSLGNNFYRIVIGAALLSLSLLLLPELYGDGYHAIKDGFIHSGTNTFNSGYFILILTLLIAKPIITSVTLGAGGDGGVFAPSIFIGAFLGLATAMLINSFSDFKVIPVNFMVAGMAAMLSASIHAPLTALFLVCGLVNDYTLFIPILVVCFVAKITSKYIYPYNVYTYKDTAHAA